MSYIESLVTAVATSLTISLVTYIIMKKTIRDTKNDIKQEAEEWLNSEKGQKALYSIGGLLAAGFSSGLGIKAGGKMKLQDILIQLGVGWAQKAGFLPSAAPQGEQQTSETFKTPF